MWRALLLFCTCALPAPWLGAQTPLNAPAPLLMPESRLPAKHSVPVFGQKIAYYDTGSGPVVVLVHGFGSQARFDWGNVILPLAKQHRVLALDQIGFGSSDKPFIDYSIQTYVDFLGEFLRTLNIHEFTLVGESLGGWISALYTIESLAPENTGPHALPRPQRLILEDAAGMAALPTGPIVIPGPWPMRIAWPSSSTTNPGSPRSSFARTGPCSSRPTMVLPSVPSGGIRKSRPKW
jgi:pimeloyl-ACP methyl ester carboxylesterase